MQVSVEKKEKEVEEEGLPQIPTAKMQKVHLYFRKK